MKVFALVTFFLLSLSGCVIAPNGNDEFSEEVYWNQNGLGQTFGENSSNFVIPTTTTNGCEYFFLEDDQEYPAPENGYCSIMNNIDRYSGSERTTVVNGDHSLHCSDDSAFEKIYDSNCYELYFTQYGAIQMLSIPTPWLLDENFDFTDVDHYGDTVYYDEENSSMYYLDVNETKYYKPMNEKSCLFLSNSISAPTGEYQDLFLDESSTEWYTEFRNLATLSLDEAYAVGCPCIFYSPVIG
jgi:hypothetical protein